VFYRSDDPTNSVIALTTLLQCFDAVVWVIRPVKHRLRNDLSGVEWDVKPCSIYKTQLVLKTVETGGRIYWLLGSRLQECQCDSIVAISNGSSVDIVGVCTVHGKNFATVHRRVRDSTAGLIAFDNLY